MSDDEIQGTLTFDQDIQDLPEEDNDTNDRDQPPPAAASVNLLSFNTHAASIPLTRNKTILGRAAGKCTEGAVLDNPRISGTHCEVSSRSMTDADAAIWIKDTSSNGVWVNEKRIPKNETLKIFDKDIISFAPGHVDGKFDAPAFMLMDKRIKSSPKDTQQQQSVPKRANEDIMDGSTSAADNQSSEPEQKKQKTDAAATTSLTTADGVSAKEKEEEDNAFEQEFECGVCHEIMHKPMILQPCLHSFCRGCSKSWLKQSTVCPSCRQEVTRTRRDFKLNSLITLFLKTRPHMERDDVEEDGADSDKSDLVGRRPGHRNRNYHNGNDDDEEEYDEDDEDEDNDDGFNGPNGYLRPLPVGFQGRPVTCPCCYPNNNVGFTCPDGVRLAPLAADANYVDYQARLQPQPGHSQCQSCHTHIPVIPEDQDLAYRFKCKMCHVATCGCTMSSVDEKAARIGMIDHYLNHFEMNLIREYLQTQNMTVQQLWQEIKIGMDNGTYYYLGTGPVPNPPPAPAAAPANAAVDGADGEDEEDPVDAALPAPDQHQQQQPAAAAAGVAAGGAANDQEVRATRARTVKSCDRLCYNCSRDFFSNGPLYQWRKSLDAAVLPARALGRSDCWYGRQCRTQHNIGNRAHAERLNHICENTRR
ncbi:hypothetical protein BGW39_008202 [Mortierella sp. 14UC]|nr:hypothetical protein BGW39_008202 [Mortierella sp. 14UC]